MIAVETLRRLLADELEDVARHLLGEVKVSRAGELRGRDRDNVLWILQLRGTKAGLALNGDGSGANAFDFVRRAGGCGSVADACRLAESLLGLADAGPGRERELARHAESRRIEARAQAERDARQRAADVKARTREYAQGTALPAESAAALYLQGRACLPPAPAGAALRSAIHVSREGYRTGSTMLAPLAGPDGMIRGWHETALRRNGRGGWVKADGIAKRVWGQAKGGLIPLAPGATAGGETLLLSEGIENGLTAHLLLPELEAAAAYAVGNLAHLELPARVRRIVLCRDRESNPRSHGPRARAAAIARWWSEGRAVTVLDPPQGHGDLNDAARAGLAQRNTPGPLDPAALLAQAAPVGEVPQVAAFVARLGGEAPELALAHPAIEAGGMCYPALLLRAVGLDGAVQGVAARLIDDTGALTHPVLWAGERAGTVFPLRYPQRNAGRLAVGIDAALMARAELAVLDLSHLAECRVARAIYDLTLLAATPVLEDDLLLWREGVRRLHVGHELTVTIPQELQDAA